MPYCVVKGCTNYTKKFNKKKDNISYHRFPADDTLREVWTRIVRNQRNDAFFKTTKNSRICSEHFTEKDFYTTKSGLRKLLDAAKPIFKDINIIHTSCRACLQNRDSNISVMEEIVKTGFEKLTGITIQPDDHHPKTVCQECLNKFKKFLNFRKIVLDNNNYLEEISQKTETKEDEIIKFPFISVENVEHIDVKKEVNDLSDEATHTTQIFDMKNTNFLKKRKTNKIISNKKSVKSRNIIEIDPQTINVIALSVEEQMKNHEAEATKASFTSMPYKCNVCYKGFNFERKLVYHMENYHKPNSKFECVICHRTLSTAASFALHTARHSTVYECRLCGDTAVEKLQAVSHYRRQHLGISAVIVCKVCGKSFRHESTLRGHMRTQHNPSSAVECDVCHKRYKTKDSLQDHMLIHTGEKKFSCNICDKRFRLKAEVSAHLRRHYPVRTHYCAKCDVAFKCESALRRHIAHSVAHGSVRRHPCVECGRSFSTVGSLKVHSLLHDKGPTEQCGQCAAVLPLVAMRHHNKRHHGKVHRNYVCHHCAKRFTSSSSLNRHMLIHSGVKPHQCPQCDATFTQKSTLNTHIKLVHLKLKRNITKPP